MIQQIQGEVRQAHAELEAIRTGEGMEEEVVCQGSVFTLPNFEVFPQVLQTVYTLITSFSPLSYFPEFNEPSTPTLQSFRRRLHSHYPLFPLTKVLNKTNDGTTNRLYSDEVC
jgi:hypothetical protein